MSTTQQNPASGPLVVSPVRVPSVILGQKDYLSVLLRLTGAELYKLRRRIMPLILLIIGIFLMIAGSALIGAITIFISAMPASTYLPPPCSQVQQSGAQVTCLDRPPTAAELDLAEKQKREVLNAVAEPLHLPGSFTNAMNGLSFTGLILLLILAGSIMGGEYGAGTIRLLYTRGPTRTQFFLAKIGALLVSLVLGSFILALVSMLTGALFSLIPGIKADNSFLDWNWLVHAYLYAFATLLGIFTYLMAALSLSIIGKSTAAGVAGGILFWVLESVLNLVLTVSVLVNNDFLRTAIKTLESLLLTNNISALVQNQAHEMTGAVAPEISSPRALLTILIYLALFIGIGWWVNKRRDVTN
jgi:ABC-type transport system involved in multi-copper enzyme maturation permease subunit